MSWRAAVSFALLTSVSVQAQWLSIPTPDIPRTADGAPDLSAEAPVTDPGHPDLSGLWVATKVSGDLPDSDKFHDWVRTAMVDRKSNFFADQPRYNCLPSGPSYLTAGATSTGYRLIYQSPTQIAFLFEDMVFRPIYMDGRQLEPDPLPTWMGYSVGRWDGDTLVVESNGYNDKTWLDRRGAAHTDQLRIIERYTRLDFGHIQLDVTYDDPGAFHEPLDVRIEMIYQADNQLLEYVCNETSQLGSNWIGDISQAELRAVEIPPEALEKYVGTFQGYWLNNLIRLDFTIENGELKLLRNGVEVRVIPQSQTTFDGSNGFGFIFSLDADGNALSVEEMHVSGGWSFPRTE